MSDSEPDWGEPSRIGHKDEIEMSISALHMCRIFSFEKILSLRFSKTQVRHILLNRAALRSIR